MFADPFVSGTSADEKNLINAASNGGRMDNSIKYASPMSHGVSAERMYAAGRHPRLAGRQAVPGLRRQQGAAQLDPAQQHQSLRLCGGAGGHGGHARADLGIDAAAFGFGAGLFFVGYALFEVPSNMMMLRFGAKAWLTRIMFTWGVAATAMALVQGAHSFYALRFLLGVAEAGFFPGVVFYFTPCSASPPHRCWAP